MLPSYDIFRSGYFLPSLFSSCLTLHALADLERLKLKSTAELKSTLSPNASWFTDPKDRNVTIHLKPPTLNISIFDDSVWSYLNDPRKHVAFTYKDRSINTIFDTNYVDENGLCSQAKNYQWGFSGLLLFFAIILTTIWAIGMWLMAIDVHLHSRLDRHERRLGGLRVALDVSRALPMHSNSEKASLPVSDNALRKRVEGAGSKITIAYMDLIDESITIGRVMDTSIGWSERRTFWIATIFILTVFGLLVAVESPLVYGEDMD